MIAFSLLSVILVSLGEWWHYRQVLELAPRPPIDSLALLGVLALKNASLLALPSVLALALRRLPRLGAAVLLAWWMIVMGFLALDLVCQRLLGAHIMPFLWFGYDVISSPQGEGMKFAGGTSAIVVPVVVTVGGFLLLEMLIWKVSRALRPRALACLGALLAVVALFPLGATDAAVLARAYQALPTSHPWLRRLTLDLWAPLNARPVGIVAVDPRPVAGEPSVTIRNHTSKPIDLSGYRLKGQPLEGTLTDSRVIPVSLAPDGDVVELVGPGNRHRVQYSAAQAEPGQVLQVLDPTVQRPFVAELNRDLGPEIARFERALAAPPPLDTRVQGQKHVVWILLESWRHNSVNRQDTPLLASWFARGLWLERHYSGSNTSHLGIYSLLYSRNPILYKRDLAAYAPPLASEIFRQAGYQTHFQSATAFHGWKQLDRFMNDRCWDTFEVEWAVQKDYRDWIERDRVMLERILRIVRNAQKPQFVVAFVQSTHYPFAYPPEFARRPALEDVSLASFARATPEQVRNRYANSVSYVESLLDKMLRELDLENTVVVITGDHGESIWEDGTLAHGSRASDIQCRVPCVILGGGVRPGVLSTATVHADLLPTVLHAVSGQKASVPEGQGRDLLAGELEDQVMLSPLRSSPPYQMVLIRGDQRLLLTVDQPLSATRPDLGPDVRLAKLSVTGLLDSRGQLRYDYDSTASAWQAPLKAELNRFNLLP